jgi:peptide chain release factor subunit 1
MASMQTSDVTPDRLQRLATFEAPGGARVLSLYLNLDPAANLAAPANRRSAVTSLLGEAHRAVEGQEELDRDARLALREDVKRAREELDANLDDGWAEGAHALALFVCGPADVFEVVRLPRPVDSRVTIAERPAVEPLTETGPAERWAVFVLDGDDARLLEGVGDRLEEVASTSRSHRGTATADLSARRYDGAVGLEERRFVEEAVELLRERDEREPYARIVIGATERIHDLVVATLAEPVRERVIGRVDAGADWEAPEDLRAKVEPLLRIEETHREAEKLREAAHTGVRGLVSTLPALYERRVDTLLIEPGLEHPGVVCPRCRWAAAEERGTCPVDGETMQPHENLVEWAVELAIEQRATVLPLRHHNDLAEHDGIGAALRF